MTKPTPHGQVPEALIDLIDAYAETRHRCGGIYNARTEAARKTVIEALSGAQAPSQRLIVTIAPRAMSVQPQPHREAVMLNDVLGLTIAAVVLFCACITTWAWAHHTVATECERLGAFYVNEKTFNCQLKSGDTP